MVAREKMRMKEKKIVSFFPSNRRTKRNILNPKYSNKLPTWITEENEVTYYYALIISFSKTISERTDTYRLIFVSVYNRRSDFES